MNLPQPQRNLLEEYHTTADHSLSPEKTLDLLRASGLSAMIDAENGLWINEICMGKYNSVYAQNKVKERLSEE
ncbi:MAG: hypothetical protein FWG01_04575 [Betaproteobacteria bacterium]|nr:hypothetical protein [Betaproteobacteria bacterium]